MRGSRRRKTRGGRRDQDHPAVPAVGAVVNRDVAPRTIVVGVPARVIGQGNVRPSADMDQSLDS